MSKIEIYSKGLRPEVKRVQIQFKNYKGKSTSFTIRGTNDVNKVASITYFALKDILESDEDKVTLVFNNLFKKIINNNNDDNSNVDENNKKMEGEI